MDIDAVPEYKFRDLEARFEKLQERHDLLLKFLGLRENKCEHPNVDPKVKDKYNRKWACRDCNVDGFILEKLEA